MEDLRSVQDRCFCAFEDEDDELTAFQSDQAVNKLKEARYLDGLRDGIEEGHKQELQEGFNLGCQHGFQKILPVSKMRGVLWALLKNNHRETVQTRIQTLFNHCEKIENEIISSNTTVPNHTGDISSTSIKNQDIHLVHPELPDLLKNYNTLLLELGINL